MDGKELEILMRMTNWNEDGGITGGERWEDKLNAFSCSVKKVLEEVKEGKDILVKRWRERVEHEVFENFKKFKELGGGIYVVDIMRRETGWRLCLSENFTKWLKEKVLNNGVSNLSLRIEGMFRLGEAVRREKDGILMGEIFLQRSGKRWYFLSPWEKLSLWVEFLLFLWFCGIVGEGVTKEGRKIERGIYTANWFEVREVKRELLKEALKHTVDVGDMIYFEELRFFLSEIVRSIGGFIKWEVPERFSWEQVREMVKSVGKDRMILDDFGDMHSGFKFYTEVGGDFLKVDIRQITEGVGDTEEMFTVKKVMLQFLKKFLLLIKGKLVIERVEREKELEEFLMRARGIGLSWEIIMEQVYFQGFFFSRGVEF